MTYLGNIYHSACSHAKVWLWMLRRGSLRHAVLSYSQEGEDMILRRLFSGRSTGFYVDVGAHHPYRFSNTCHFYRRGWRGINIEPNPLALPEFALHRGRDINLGVGIAEHAGDLTYYAFNEPALNTFDVDVATGRESSAEYWLIGETRIPVMRLDDVLTQHLPADTGIDYLNIDVEGLDLQVLRSNNWTRFRPRYVLVEALRTPLENIFTSPIHGYMREQRYELIAKTFNTLIFCDCCPAEILPDAGIDPAGNL